MSGILRDKTMVDKSIYTSNHGNKFIPSLQIKNIGLNNIYFLEKLTKFIKESVYKTLGTSRIYIKFL